MPIELSEVVWLEQHELSLDELADLSGLPAPVLEELIAAGAIEPSPASSAQSAVALRFGGEAIRAAEQRGAGCGTSRSTRRAWCWP